MNLNRDDKLNAMGLKTTNDLPDNAINFLYKNKNKWFVDPNKTVQQEKPVNVIDKTTDKYIITLKYVNALLKNINKDQIDDLTQFRLIERDDLLCEANKKTFHDMEDEIFKYFNKKKCSYYKKSPSYVLICLKAMCKIIGLKVSIKKKTICKNTIQKTHIYYSITHIY
jgi:hypothetical protein